MTTYPPATLPQPVTRDLEELADAFAYLLATDDRTKAITWILGNVGMGGPQAIPFGYISIQPESVRWYTARGGQGGLGAGGAQGLDDWLIPVQLLVAYDRHDEAPPQTATPPSANAFGQLPGPLPYQEQPGWRASMELWQPIKAVLRQNITIGGFAATTNITESKPVLLNVQNSIYRALRITVQTQQRRARGA